MLNSLIIEGRIVREAAVKELSNDKGTKAINFSIAHHKSKEEAIFLDCVAYNKTAELIGNLPKGTQIILQGRINQRKWEDENQVTHVVEIIVDKFHYTGKKSESESSENAQENNN